MSDKNTHKLGDVLKDYFNALGYGNKLIETKIINNWEQFTNKTTKFYTKDILIKNKKLYLNINSVEIKHNLLSQKIQLIDKINSFAETKIIEDIIIY